MEPIIDVQHISKHYKQRKSNAVVRAVDDVSFKVQRGEIMGLLGPNGAGKTTTIKTICGLLRPDSGRVLVKSKDNQAQRLEALRHISAVLEGNRNLYWRLTVRENLEYFAGNRGRSRKSVQPEIEKLLAQFHLEAKANELVNNLSRGMQQKLAIAVAMLAGTDVVLLDEPTLGLDVETGHEARGVLRQISRTERRTIIISTHDMPVVQDLCGRAVIINAGRVVVDDKVSNLLRLFETRAYSIRLRQPLSARQEALLEQAFPMLSWDDDGDRLHFTVNLEHDENIYELMDILKLQRTPVEAIDRTVINFEQVFMRIVKGATDHAVA
jgi:ABC-2 type transport system ATP-binding protein